MITQWVCQAFLACIGFLIGLFPKWDVPSWITTMTDTWRDTVPMLDKFGYWFPLNIAGLCIAGIIFAWGAALAIRLFRIAASYATLGGGSAG